MESLRQLLSSEWALVGVEAHRTLVRARYQISADAAITDCYGQSLGLCEPVLMAMQVCSAHPVQLVSVDWAAGRSNLLRQSLAAGAFQIRLFEVFWRDYWRQCFDEGCKN